MAEPEQGSQLLLDDDPVSHHSLSDDPCIVDATHEQTDHDGMSEELLNQALADANAFDSSAINYGVNGDESEACDTGGDQDHDHACGSHGLSVHHTRRHISSNRQTILVHSSESILSNTSEAIFSNGTDSLMANDNGASDGLGVESNESFAVHVGSLSGNHMISVSNDIMPGSVIISQTNGDHFQQPVVEMGDDSQLLNDEETHQQMVQHLETNYVQHSDNQILQSDSQLIHDEAFTQPHTVTVSAASGMPLTPEMLQSVMQQIQAQQLAQHQAAEQTKQSPAAAATTSQNTVSFTLVSPSQCNSTSPPLGSSQNPIRIIQQGNRYTPMQQLSPEQLQQIMQVVQQQHVNKNSQENGGAVIFNPQTNTRIMYRVIYPSELHKTQNGAGHTTYQVVRPSTSSQEQQTGTPHQKRPYRKRKDIALVPGEPGEEEEKEKNAPDAPELSKEEKEERKKHRPRTRSGRVSKPPKHMVQDYKRIHVLDWDEDYDDSDGGYSDFKHSDEEAKVKQDGDDEHSASPEFFQALGAGRPKNHKCQTCDKSYIGQAGLARHYRLNPDHCTNPCTENGSISSLHNGSIDEDDSKDASLLPDGSSSRMSDSAVDLVKINCNTSSIENISEDSNTQDSLNSTGATSPVVRRGRGRGGFRGRWAHLKHNAHMRRKNKLKELIKQCTDEELMEVVLPRLVNSVSLWEYLMMKSEKGGSRPQVDVIYHEFEALSRHVRQACADYMQPLTLEELEDDNLQCKMIKVADKNLAVCLNLEPVTYQVKAMPPGNSNSFSSLHNRLSSVAIFPSQDNMASSVSKQMSVAKGSAELLSDFGMKRPANSDDIEEFATKRAKISSMASSLSHIQTSSALSMSPSVTCTVTASLPLSVENKANGVRSESAVSSLSSSSAISPQSAQLRGQLLTVTSSVSSLASQSGTLSSKCNSTSASVRSPYIHISCPTTKQQPAPYTLTGPKKLSPVSSRVNKSQNQPMPVVISQPAGIPASKPQVLPFIMGSTSSLAGQQQKVIVSVPQNQTLHATTLPMVFVTSGNHQTSNPTVLLTSGSTSSSHRVIVRQPAPTVHGPSHVLLTHQSPPSKPQNGGLSIHSFLPNDSVTTVQTPTFSTNSRSLLGIMKPTEVRVSRQLFHEATCPSMPSQALTNGHSVTKSGVTCLDLSPVLQQLSPTPTMVSSHSHAVATVGGGVVSNDQQLCVRSGNNKTLVTPPSGQQFAASPNKTSIGSQMTGVVDISVLAAMELSGDDLGPLNTSSDSLNGSLSGCSHLTDSIMSGIASTSHVAQNADVTASLVDMVQAEHTDTDGFDTVTKSSLCGSHDIPLVNGNCQSYMREKDDCSHTSSLSSPRLPSLTLSETPDYIHITSKHSKLISSITQDSSSIVSSAPYHMVTNGPLSSHGLKPDISLSSSIMLTDMSSLPFTDQGTAHIVDGVTGHLSSISPILSSDELQESTINILQEPLSCSDTHEADSQLVDLGETAISDSLIGAEEEEQLMLSEDATIYQTEDGTLIIQKANGNTYQLQGAHGLSLETVQALFSGNLDQLVAGDGSACTSSLIFHSA